LEPALHAPARVKPVGQHLGDDAEVIHAVHDDSAEIGPAEIALHVLVVPMQRVVVERGFTKGADAFAGGRERRTFYPLARLQAVESGAVHDGSQKGRMVQPRPEQMTSSCW